MVVMFCMWATAATLFGLFGAPRYDEYIFIDGSLKFEEICFSEKWEVSGEDSAGVPYHYNARDVELVLQLRKNGLNVKYVNSFKYDVYSNDSVICKRTGETILLKPLTLTSSIAQR
ncbi:MAG: hypothetical protein AB9842_02755 [Bacteroidales bacterium]